MVWFNRQKLSELFDRDIKTIRKHNNNALNEELNGELTESSKKYICNETLAELIFYRRCDKMDEIIELDIKNFEKYIRAFMREKFFKTLLKVLKQIVDKSPVPLSTLICKKLED